MARRRFRRTSTKSSAEEQEVLIEANPQENSPYAEVRAAVPNVDDPDLPQSTIRMWVLGITVVTFLSGANLLFFLHSPSATLTPYIGAIIVWPLGRLWDIVVPNYKIFGMELNPGPFNIKEHCLIVVMALNLGVGVGYGPDIIVTLRQFYKDSLGSNWGFQVMLVLSTQLIGLGFSGFARRILIYPAAMIWPPNLVTVTFLTNIHMKYNHVANGWKISRLKFFLIVASIGSAYQWLPSFLATFLSDFDFAAWIAPNNIVVNQVFGTISGLGLFPIAFDWNMIAGFLGSPLIPPLGTIVNIAVTMLLFYWLIVPIVHYTNVWWGHYLPIVGNTAMDRYQHPYDAERVLTNNHFDQTKYENYSPLFLPASFAMSYGLSFAVTTATVVHSLLFDSRDILRYWKTSRTDRDDIHMRLMRSYKEAPLWWYALLVVACVATMLAMVLHFPTGLNVGYMFLGIVISAAMMVPIALIYATTSMLIGLNVIAEFMIGYMQPGRPLAMMLFKTIVYYTNYMAISFAQSMKLGHYVKLNPVVLFWVQLVGGVIGGLSQLAVNSWVTSSIDNICEPDQELGYTCASTRTFFVSSIIWGLIGPQRHFKIYYSLLSFFAIGAALPLLSWLWLKKWPRSAVRYIHWPVFFSAAGMLPPATPFNYNLWLLVGLIFAYWVRRNWFSWWAKYNYTLSAALDLSVAVGQALILAVIQGRNISAPQWWGTKGAYDTADARSEPLVSLEPGQWFGPSKW